MPDMIYIDNVGQEKKKEVDQPALKISPIMSLDKYIKREKKKTTKHIQNKDEQKSNH